MSFRLRQSTRRNLSPKTSFRRTSSSGRPRASTGQSSAVSFRHRETTHNLTHRTTPELTRQTTSKPTRPPPEPSLAPTSAPPCPILFSFPISPRRKNFYRDHPTNAFSSARIYLFRFIVVKFRSLLSHERPVCTLRCRRLLHFPRPSSEARRFFFCPSPRKRRSGSALASGAPVADAHFLLQSSRFPILRARFTQSAPSARPFSATVPRHPRLRPRPPPAARNTVPFTPSPRPASPRPATLPRNHPTTPPRTGLQARFVPRRSRSGP